MDIFTDDVDLHHVVSLKIAEALRSKESASYAELLPDGMSGNAFNYHLRGLLRDDFIIKNDDGSYSLGVNGKLFADSASVHSGKLKLRPVAGVYLIVLNNKDEILSYSSKHQPLINYEGLIFGKSRLGVSNSEVLRRNIEKRGLETVLCSSPSCLGVMSLMYERNGQLIAHHIGSV